MLDTFPLYSLMSPPLSFKHPPPLKTPFSPPHWSILTSTHPPLLDEVTAAANLTPTSSSSSRRRSRLLTHLHPTQSPIRLPNSPSHFRSTLSLCLLLFPIKSSNEPILKKMLGFYSSNWIHYTIHFFKWPDWAVSMIGWQTNQVWLLVRF